MKVKAFVHRFITIKLFAITTVVLSRLEGIWKKFHGLEVKKSKPLSLKPL